MDVGVEGEGGRVGLEMRVEGPGGVSGGRVLHCASFEVTVDDGQIETLNIR